MLRFAPVVGLLALMFGCGAPQLSPEDAQARWVELNAVQEEHGILAVLEGSFSAEVSAWEAPGADPQTFRGFIENKLVMGRRFLRSDYSSDLGEMGVMRGIGLLGYNTFEGRYESFWADTFSTALPPVSYGHAEADGMELHFAQSSYDPMRDRVVNQRSVLRVQDRRTHTFEIYTESPDGEEFLELRMVYTKL